jgi:hypothetical protein
MSKETTLATIAIVSALGLLGLVIIETIPLPQQQADARCRPGGTGYNAS